MRGFEGGIVFSLMNGFSNSSRVDGVGDVDVDVVVVAGIAVAVDSLEQFS